MTKSKYHDQTDHIYKYLKYIKKYQDIIKEYYEKFPDFINPASYPYYGNDSDSDSNSDSDKSSSLVNTAKAILFESKHEMYKLNIIKLTKYYNDLQVKDHIAANILIASIDPLNHTQMINDLIDYPKQCYNYLIKIVIPAVIALTKGKNPMYEFNLDLVLVPNFNLSSHLVLRTSFAEFSKIINK